MIALRLYLLAGLIAHKLVWEVLKRRQPGGAATPAARSAFARLAKGVKTLILAGLVAQTVLPDVLPISHSPNAVRAIGVLVFTLGLAVAVVGRVQLGGNWSDIETAQILRAQRVVSTGIYAYIRHPIYSGDLLLLTGFELALNSWCVLGVGLIVPFVVQRAVREERMLAGALPGYDAYRARTKRFVPYVV